MKKTDLEKICSNKIEKISAYVAEYLCVVKVKSVVKYDVLGNQLYKVMLDSAGAYEARGLAIATNGEIFISRAQHKGKENVCFKIYFDRNAYSEKVLPKPVCFVSGFCSFRNED